MARVCALLVLRAQGYKTLVSGLRFWHARNCVYNPCRRCLPAWLAKDGYDPETVRALLNISEVREAMDSELLFRVITICGSMRFKDRMLIEADQLSREGWIVLFPFVTFTAEEQANGHPDKTMLDKMHFAKIDMSSAILVVNPGGHVGDSTKREIAYAVAHGKIITTLEPLYQGTIS